MNVKEITWAPERMKKHLDKKEGKRFLRRMTNKEMKTSKYPMELQELVREKVTQLPSEQLVVIYLSFWEGLCEYEIAKEIRMSISNVLEIKNIALENLRHLLLKESKKEPAIA